MRRRRVTEGGGGLHAVHGPPPPRPRPRYMGRGIAGAVLKGWPGCGLVYVYYSTTSTTTTVAAGGRVGLSDVLVKKKKECRGGSTLEGPFAVATEKEEGEDEDVKKHNFSVESEERVWKKRLKVLYDAGGRHSAAAAERQQQTQQQRRVKQQKPKRKQKQRVSMDGGDEEMVVGLMKPGGLASQGGAGVVVSVDGLLPLLSKGSSRRDDDGKLRLVHRLDKEVSGVLVVGRGKEGARRVGRWMDGGDVDKVYWGVVCGGGTGQQWDDDGSCNGGSRRSSSNTGNYNAGFKMGGKNKSEIGKSLPCIEQGEEGVVRMPVRGLRAETTYRVMGKWGDLYWLELKPKTGRKHQIRLHCAYGLGMPICGDETYGRMRGNAGMQKVLDLVGHGVHEDDELYSWPPMLLHCRQMKIPVEGRGERFIKIEAPLPRFWRRVFDPAGWRYRG